MWNPAEALSVFIPDRPLAGLSVQAILSDRPEACNPVLQEYFQKVNSKAADSTSAGEVLKMTFWATVILGTDPMQPFNALVYLSDCALYVCEVLSNACSSTWSADNLPLKLVISSPLGKLPKCSVGMDAMCFEDSNAACTFSLLTFSNKVTEDVVTVLHSLAAEDELPGVAVTNMSQKDVVALDRVLLQDPDATLPEDVNGVGCEEDVDFVICTSLMQVHLPAGVNVTPGSSHTPLHLIILVSKGDMLYLCQVNHLLGPSSNLGDMKVATRKYMLQTCLPLSHLQEITMLDAQFAYMGSVFPLYALVLSFSNGVRWQLLCCSQVEGDRLVQQLQQSTGKEVKISHSSVTTMASMKEGQLCPVGNHDGVEHGSDSELKSLHSCLSRRSKCHLSTTLSLSGAADKAAPEELCLLFYTHCLPYSSMDDVFEVIAVMTNQHIHLVSSEVIAQRWKTTIGDVSTPVSSNCYRGLVTLLSMPIRNITEVATGVFDQSLRITSQDSAAAFSLITGDEMVTEGILHHLKECVSDHQTQVQDTVFRYSETLEFDKLKSCIEQCVEPEGPLSCGSAHIFGYLVAQEYQSTTGMPSVVVMRTIVLTSVCLHVVKEDYVRWPLLPSVAVLPSWDQYVVEKTCFLSQIVSVEVSSPSSTDFCVVVQAEENAPTDEQLMQTTSLPVSSGQTGSVQWQFNAASYIQREKFLTRLKEAWESVQNKALPFVLCSLDSAP